MCHRRKAHSTLTHVYYHHQQHVLIQLLVRGLVEFTYNHSRKVGKVVQQLESLPIKEAQLTILHHRVGLESLYREADNLELIL